MRRGTTPILKLSLSGIAISAIDECYVTLAQGSHKLTKEGDDVEVDTTNSKLKVKLTEEETLSFKPNAVMIQLRAVTKDGNVIATNIVQIMMQDVLYEEVILEEET